MKIKKETWVNIFCLLAIILFLFSYFKPDLIFSKTITTGGDTASHYYTASFMKNELIPNFQIRGWTPGNYAGFPILHFYFPIPFLLMGLLGYIIPLEIAFKIITVFGIFSLPLATFYFFKLQKFRFPIPIIGAISSLFFLFIESHSMWGGNIPSTLAGEFTYSISLSLGVLFLGTLYKGINENKHLILNSILFTLVVLNHVYVFLVVGLTSLFFLLTKKNFGKNLKYLVKLYLLSFLLMSFWLIPLLAKIKFTTSYVLKWITPGLSKLAPAIIIPSLILAGLSFLILLNKKARKDHRIFYLFFPVLVSIMLYFAATTVLEVVDIRFVPFIHLFLIFTGVFALDKLMPKNLNFRLILPLILVIASILWVQYNVEYIDHWINWNYEGFEKKADWPTFRSINEFLKGDFNDPRVVYEHSDIHNKFGSVRAFESLPFFANRATLEGVYFQASPSAPSVFYIQSEVSQKQSCPFPTFVCTNTNIAAAINHLKLFNVNQIIAVSPLVKNQLRTNAKSVFQEKEYEIFEIKTEGYVTVPEYWPTIIENKNHDLISYLWLIKNKEVPVIIKDNPSKRDLELFQKVNSLNTLPKKPINKECYIESNLKREEIIFKTDCIGLPHIVKVSYFPNWKVKGAKELYYVSPSFMLVVPDSENVKLYYGYTFSDMFGIFLSLLGLFLIWRIRKRKNDFKFIDNIIEKFLKKKILFGLLVILVIFLFLFSSLKHDKERDVLNLEIAKELKKFTHCQNAGSLKDKCFIETAKLTHDSNLCIAKVSKKNRDLCYKELSVVLNDLNMCKTKVIDKVLKEECLRMLESG